LPGSPVKMAKESSRKKAVRESQEELPFVVSDEHIELERATVVRALKAVIDVLPSMLGPNVEVVLHDLIRPERSIIAIANGHVSGRSVGQAILSGPRNDRAFAEAKKELTTRSTAKHSVTLNYPTVAADGRKLRSATALFRDARGEPFCALCLNADMAVFEMAHAWLEKFIHGNREPETHAQKSPGLDELMDEVIADAVNEFGKAPALMKKEEKIHAVNIMMQRGLFIVKGGVETAARALGVTRFTIYNYLEECRQNGTIAPEMKSAVRGRVRAKKP